VQNVRYGLLQPVAAEMRGIAFAGRCSLRGVHVVAFSAANDKSGCSSR
jgi:hypothetical protein